MRIVVTCFFRPGPQMTISVVTLCLLSFLFFSPFWWCSLTDNKSTSNSSARHRPSAVIFLYKKNLISPIMAALQSIFGVWYPTTASKNRSLTFSKRHSALFTDDLRGDFPIRSKRSISYLFLVIQCALRKTWSPPPSPAISYFHPSFES